MAVRYVTSSSSSSDPYAESSFGFFKKDKDYSGSGVQSGYGHEYHDRECCPLVIDLLCLGAIMFSIAGASILLSRVMEIELMTGRKRSLPYQSFVNEGKISTFRLRFFLGYVFYRRRQRESRNLGRFFLRGSIWT